MWNGIQWWFFLLLLCRRLSTHLHLKQFWWPHALAHIFWRPTTNSHHNTIKSKATCTSSSQSKWKMFPFRVSMVISFFFVVSFCFNADMCKDHHRSKLKTKHFHCKSQWWRNKMKEKWVCRVCSVVKMRFKLENEKCVFPSHSGQ